MPMLNSTKTRTVRLFKNGHNQAIRIPRGFELPGVEALLRREANRLIIEPVETESLHALLESWPPLEEGLPEIQDNPPEAVVF